MNVEMQVMIFYVLGLAMQCFFIQMTRGGLLKAQDKQQDERMGINLNQTMLALTKGHVANLAN